MKIVIVSGLSGSGKTIALNTLEDLGFYCIDNLPVGIIPTVIDHLRDKKYMHDDQIGIGIDARNHPEQLENFNDLIKDIKAKDECTLLFLKATKHALFKRFSETRRRHPLSEGGRPLEEAILLEEKQLEPIAVNSDVTVDTTHTTVHQLRDAVRQRMHAAPRKLSLLFQSFGFKNSVPADTDFVFDVRCLPNPHWVPDLRPQNGLDQPVADFLGAEEDVQKMLADLKQFLDNWVPKFEAENRSYLTVAIGCTGGQHRSVYISDQLAKYFSEKRSNVTTRHRELKI